MLYLLQFKGLSLPHPAAKLVEEEGNGNHSDRDETQQRVSPTEPQSVVHWSPCHRQKGTCQTPQYRICGNGRRRICWVAVNEICHDSLHDARDADSEGHQGQHWHNPVRLVVCRPAVPEESDWDEKAKADADGQSHLGFEDAVVGLSEPHDRSVAEHGDEYPTGEVAEADGDVDEAGHARAEAIRLLENARHCCEEEVQAAVDEGDVEGEEKDERRQAQHLGRPDQAVEQKPGFARAAVVANVAALQVGSARLFLQTVDLLLDEDAVVGFLVEDLDERRNNHSDDEDDPEVPAPADGLSQETADDWTDGWTEKGT